MMEVIRTVRVRLSEKVTFEQLLEGGEGVCSADCWEKPVGRACTKPSGVCWSGIVEKQQKSQRIWAEQLKEQVVGDEVRVGERPSHDGLIRTIWILKGQSGCNMRDESGGMGSAQMWKKMATIQVRNDTHLYVCCCAQYLSPIIESAQ